MGENGAGKSTLIKVLTGVYSKDGGTITLEGLAIGKWRFLKQSEIDELIR